MIRTDDPTVQLVRPVFPGLKGPTTVDAAFRVGETLKGTVLSVLGENRAAVRLGGQDLLAWTSHPLRAGEEIAVRVEQLSPQLTVRLLHRDGAPPDRFSTLFRLYLPQKLPLGEALRHLAGILEALSSAPSMLQQTSEGLESFLRGWLAGEVETSTDRPIQTQLQRSGIFYESTLAEWIAQGKEALLSAMAGQDLKGVLLKLDQQLGLELIRLAQSGQPVPERTTELARAVTALLANLELNQLTNLWARENGGWMLYPFPGPADEAPSEVRLYVRRDQGEGSDPARAEYFQLVLMLEPTHLGRLRVDLSVLGRHLSASIHVAFDETRSFLAPALSELGQALSEAGFDNRLEIKTADSAFLAERLEEGPEGEKPSNLLSVRV